MRKSSEYGQLFLYTVVVVLFLLFGWIVSLLVGVPSKLDSIKVYALDAAEELGIDTVVLKRTGVYVVEGSSRMYTVVKAEDGYEIELFCTLASQYGGVLPYTVTPAHNVGGDNKAQGYIIAGNSVDLEQFDSMPVPDGVYVAVLEAQDEWVEVTLVGTGVYHAKYKEKVPDGLYTATVVSGKLLEVEELSEVYVSATSMRKLQGGEIEVEIGETKIKCRDLGVDVNSNACRLVAQANAVGVDNQM